MKVEDLRIIDVVRSDDFQSELGTKLDAMKKVRDEARKEHGNRLASHPKDFLLMSGFWNAETMSSLFEAVIDKKAALSRSKREFVLDICVPVFRKVMQRLIDNEKKSEEKPKKPKKKRNFVSNNTTPTEQ